MWLFVARATTLLVVLAMSTELVEALTDPLLILLLPGPVLSVAAEAAVNVSVKY